MHRIDVYFIGRIGFVALKPRYKLICVGKDFFDCAWHVYHLKNFSRARIAWMTTMAVVPWA